MSDAIALKHVAYRPAKEFAIRDLSMTVPTGAIYGFLGPNGSGKTTTIKLLLGMLEAARGVIEVLGHTIPQGAPQALARIGYVPERLHLYGSLTVGEIMDYHRAFYATWDAGRAAELRGQFSLRTEQKIERLSKGESGKLMMLLALATQPELLVLDEPTDGLDPVVRRDVLAALVEYVSARNATVLVSSHLVHEQERICDWVGVMDDGALVAEMPMHTFRSGIKRLRVSGAPPVVPAAPFTILGRTVTAGAEKEWGVRGWQPEMAAWFTAQGATLREVIDLDLEESFVELLSTARSGGTA
ncbi:MAG: ABC transporter ATP-binding protein [Gemmatimonadetes bacterium]|nr:ABC transporter ATP-binding protein [Gemmatimonadota bacterium]